MPLVAGSKGGKRSKTTVDRRADRVIAAGQSLAETGRRLNRDPTLLGIMRSIRSVLPGDSRVADPNELGAERRPRAVGRMLSMICDGQAAPASGPPEALPSEEQAFATASSFGAL